MDQIHYTGRVEISCSGSVGWLTSVPRLKVTQTERRLNLKPTLLTFLCSTRAPFCAQLTLHEK